ncbi:hypothetical protein J437_LFUL016223 [Ladona fulva]|uniref:Uncharacterized protein n=1 Tax=Ladona fulva TaxID=123851 RepID=A0A8K0KLR5_LADFU|nr:hypothetical protein J437_LFUL016223 [Ladona fulva]
MALNRRAYIRPSRQGGLPSLGEFRLMPRQEGGSRWCAQRVWARACLEPPPVQILVVVANTPAGPWRTDVEKGFVGTAVAHESVDPQP